MFLSFFFFKQKTAYEIVVREQTGNRSLVLFDSGDEVTVQAGEEGIRFLLVSGKPIREPVAWYGPIVMNTKAELEQAVPDLQRGTVITQMEERRLAAQTTIERSGGEAPPRLLHHHR